MAMETGVDLTGGCRCGAVRYAVRVEKRPAAYACHCLDCQTWSGSAFSEAMYLLEPSLAVTGDVVVYELTSPSGRISRHRVCPVCRTRLFNTNSARPGFAVLRAGTLNDSDTLNVVAHIWTKRKQPWLAIADGIPSWREAAPPADFMAALGVG